MTKPFCIVKKVKSVFVGVVALSAMSLFVACGGESNPSSAEPTSSSANIVPTSSDTQENPAISAGSGTVDGNSSSSVATGEPSVGGGATAAPYNVTPAPIATTPDADGFYYIADVYKAVPATSKIVFVIRHSERQSCESQESKLTAEGIEHAKKLGADIGGDEPFYYASTDFIRTRATASNIAEGRSETADVVTWDAINGGYFLKTSSDEFDALVRNRGGSWKILSQYIYGATITNTYVATRIDDYIYDVMSRGDQFIKEVVLDNMADWKRVSILATHDVLIEPLIVYASNRSVDLKFYESGRWASYMSGIAVVVDAAGAVSLYPVRGYETGWMGAAKSTTTCPEDEAAE